MSAAIRDAERFLSAALDEYRERPTAYGRHAVEQARVALDEARRGVTADRDPGLLALVRRWFGAHPA